MTICVEPWAREYEAAVGEVWEVEATGPECGCSLDVQMESDKQRATVWSWMGSTVAVFRNGQLVDRCDQPVPAYPGHTTDAKHAP